MKTKALYSIILASAALTPLAAADELNQTISVTKETEVVEHKAEKMEALPDAAPSTASPVKLKFSDWAVPAAVNPWLVVQNPQRQDDGFEFSTKRGYAEFGMGNYMNMVGSLGYRVVDKERMSMNIWLQHNSTNGSISNYATFDPFSVGNGEARKKFFVEDRIGADFASRLKAGELSAALVYHLSKFNYYGMMLPASKDDVERKQGNNEVGLGLQWLSRANDERSFGYHAGIGYNYFGYADPVEPALEKALTEHNFSINAGAEFVWDEDSHIGVNAEVNSLSYKNRVAEYGGFNQMEMTFGARLNDRSQSVTTLTPYYLKSNDRINLRIGARLDIASSGTVFHIAPDVRFDYTINNRASLAVSATGGNRMNPLHVIAERNRYVNPSMALIGNTYTLVDAEARLNIGLFKGLSLSPFVGFAVVRDAYVPEIGTVELLGDWNFSTPDMLRGTVRYVQYDLNGVKLGLDVAYKLRSVAEVKVGYMFTPQGKESGYIANDDRAEHQFNAALTVRPIKKLDINVAYQFRSGRNVVVCNTVAGSAFVNLEQRSLGVVSDFSLGATYRINDILHVYAQGNNLFNRRWQDYFTMRNQGVNFLVGVGAKF